MKMIKHISKLFLMLTLVSIGCKSSKSDPSKTVSETSPTNLTFLDAAAASEKIVVDNSDGFFDFLSVADMSIQMKKSDMPDNGGDAKVLYQEMLRSEMSDFNTDEKAFMKEVFTSAKSAMDKLNSKLYPEMIELIKTKTNHYGQDVYYTRDRAIILPENIFDEKALDVQVPVMLHEIFHLLSRYNDYFRNKMYALIGFEEFKEALVLPPSISNKLLTNPDGVRRDYAINLKNTKGEIVRALPLIMSTKERYDPSVPIFFGYLNFDLFPLINLTPDQVTLGLNQKGGSALSIEHNGDFFAQIKDNTQYIIHPDEIMADNFMMAVLAYRDSNYEGFSPDGKKLLMDVIEILKSFDQ